MEEILREIPALNKWFDELYGPKLAEAEAKLKRERERKAAVALENALKMQKVLRQAEVASYQAVAAQDKVKLVTELARREAAAKIEVAQRKAEARIKAAQREAKAAWGQAQAAQSEVAWHQAAAAQGKVKVVAELAGREADAKIEAAQHEADAKIKAAQCEAEAASGQAQAAQREADAKMVRYKEKVKAEWLERVTKSLVRRFPKTPIEVALDLLRVSDEQHRQVINLALDAPDLATFRKELKAKVSAVSSQ